LASLKSPVAEVTGAAKRDGTDGFLSCPRLSTHLVLAYFDPQWPDLAVACFGM
jgi:hypothetical protein